MVSHIIIVAQNGMLPAARVAYRQADQDFFEAHKQITALEEQAIKTLTGENSLDISIVNSMMPKYKEKMEQAQRRMEDAKTKMEQEKEQSKEARRELEIWFLGRKHSTMRSRKQGG